MNERTFVEGMFVLSIGMIAFVIMAVFVLAICINTLKRVKSMKEYCDAQFEKISKQINASNKNSEELTKAIQQLNKNLKTGQT